MTKRLYYTDSFLREFDAQVMTCQPSEITNGEKFKGQARWWVTLDRTAFYPVSGGQPHDRGQLGQANVVDVYEREEEILHVTDQPVPSGPVRGTIEWARRFDHMQQHSGQHLLSAVFMKLFGIQTVSFHMGADNSTIDLAPGSISAEQFETAERWANEIICEDRPVTILYGTSAELSAMGVRKEVERTGILRAIQIENLDLQPCGGTHVSRTGQIGILLLRGTEKVRGNCRLEFVCGERGRKAAHNDRALLNGAAQSLACGPADVPRCISRTIEERSAGHRLRQRLLEELATLKANSLIAAAERRSPLMIIEIFSDAEMDYVRLVATKLIAVPNIVALLASNSSGQIIFAQSAGLQSDMDKLLREVLAPAGGKGGGSRYLAQGRIKGLTELPDLMERAKSSLLRSLDSHDGGA
jgi:alanyl-tRNA synthetase